jgi:hypothetical protein
MRGQPIIKKWGIVKERIQRVTVAMRNIKLSGM